MKTEEKRDMTLKELEIGKSAIMTWASSRERK